MKIMDYIDEERMTLGAIVGTILCAIFNYTEGIWIYAISFSAFLILLKVIKFIISQNKEQEKKE